jgi:hypothetical protein
MIGAGFGEEGAAIKRTAQGCFAPSEPAAVKRGNVELSMAFLNGMNRAIREQGISGSGLSTSADAFNDFNTDAQNVAVYFKDNDGHVHPEMKEYWSILIESGVLKAAQDLVGTTDEPAHVFLVQYAKGGKSGMHIHFIHSFIIYFIISYDHS